MRIFLIGYMGVGKSYWAKRLAHRWDIPLIDTDNEIAKQEGLSIVDIFKKGEEYFRNTERLLLQKTLDKYRTFVMACGGGLPCFGDNMPLMKSFGTTVWLNLSKKIIYNRLQQEQENRPIIKKCNQQELMLFIEQHLKERIMYYAQADVIIDDENIAIDALSKTIEKCIKHL